MGLSPRRLETLRLETIALAANRNNVAGHLCILFQLLPQPRDVNVHGAGSDKWLVVPHPREQALAGKHLAAMVDQLPEQLQFFSGKTDRSPGARHFATIEIHCHVAELELHYGRERRLSETAKHGAHPREQFL